MNFYFVAKKFVKLFSYLFFPVRIVGDMSKMPKDSGVVLCANHISYFDAIFLGIAFKRQIRFVGKEKYAKKPILKTLFKLLGAFGIDPDKADITAIRNCFSVVKNGEVLGIFPEGTRIIKGKISNPMPGAVMIAHKTKSPIFYVKIKPSKGTFKLFRKNYLYVGELISVADLGVTSGKGDDYKNASLTLMEKIYSLGEK